MGMLFKWTDGSLIKENPEIKSIEAFRSLSEKEMRYIILFCDMAGPLRRVPKHERQNKALRNAGFYSGGKITPEGEEIKKNKNKKVAEAVKEFRELLGWSEIEMIEGIDVTLSHFNDLMKRKIADTDDLIKIVKALPDLLKKRKEIIDIMEPNEVDEDVDKANEAKEELSYIDQINSGDAQREPD